MSKEKRYCWYVSSDVIEAKINFQKLEIVGEDESWYYIVKHVSGDRVWHKEGEDSVLLRKDAVLLKIDQAVYKFLEYARNYKEHWADRMKRLEGQLDMIETLQPEMQIRIKNIRAFLETEESRK